MIAVKRRFIFIHTPKTGGNTIQTVLEPISDDRRTKDGHQDGVERFGLKGPITPDKHASLAVYAEHVELADFTVAIGCRHPVARLVSGYFSPHRWFENMNGRWVANSPKWDVDAFVAFARETHFALDRLKVGTFIRHPEHVIRYESLIVDLNKLLRFLGCDEVKSLPIRNRSFVAPELASEVRRDPVVADLAWERHRADFDYFGYTL